ncbi:O-antigen ligase family protein [Nostoc sp. NIES-2111]
MLVAIILIALAYSWGFLQLTLVSPERWHHPIWEITADVLGIPVGSRIAVAPDRSLIALMRAVTVASAFWLAFSICQSETRSRILVFGVALIGMVYSLLGLLTLNSGYVLAVEAVSPDSVTSTFLNRNSFAEFAGIGFLAGTAMTIRELRKVEQLPEIRTSGLVALRRAPFVLLSILASLVCAAALLLSQSRGGTIATLIGFLVLVLFSLRTGRKRTWLTGVGFLVVVVIVFGLADLVVKRILDQGVIDAGRAAVRAATIYAVQDSALYGYGLDSFSAVFPMFRDDAVGVWGVWEKAHNIYLDTWISLGVVAGSFLLFGVALLVVECAIGSLKRRRNASVPTCAMAVSILVGVHGLVDFGLDIQAIALTWAALLGAGVAQSTSRRAI